MILLLWTTMIIYKQDRCFCCTQLIFVKLCHSQHRNTLHSLLKKHWRSEVFHGFVISHKYESDRSPSQDWMLSCKGTQEVLRILLVLFVGTSKDNISCCKCECSWCSQCLPNALSYQEVDQWMNQEKCLEEKTYVYVFLKLFTALVYTV